jgi:hypothetical protein
MKETNPAAMRRLIGGSLYNQPGIKHALRSLGTPLFALWALRATDR